MKPMHLTSRRSERKREVRKCRREGAAAAAAGQPITSNPYRYCDADQWNRGWLESQGMRFDQVAVMEAWNRARAAERKAQKNQGAKAS